MKKLILLLFPLLLFSSCMVDVDKSVDDPKKETTTYLQELPKDTVVISIEDENLYVFDSQTNLLKYEAISTEDTAFPIDILGIVLLLLLFFFVGVVIGSDL